MTNEPKKAMSLISLRLPGPMIEELKAVAEHKKTGGYQQLIREYIDAGVRRDKERIRWSALNQLLDALREKGVEDDVLSTALNEVLSKLPEQI